jgi:very-short-patch-repair endonuclease
MATDTIDINQFLTEILTYEDKKIKIEGTWDDPWFCGRDVCQVLGYNNYACALNKHVEQEDKKSLYELRQLRTGAEHMVQDRLNACYINKKGLTEFLLKTHKPYDKGFVNMLIDKFDLNLALKIDSKEQKYIQMIKEAFSHEKMKHQYTVSSYRIDLYFPQYRIAVECDEHGHRDRDPYYEQQREEHIKAKLSCVFLRFNPDEPCFSIFKVINSLIKIMYSGDDMYMLEQQIEGLKI